VYNRKLNDKRNVLSKKESLSSLTLKIRVIFSIFISVFPLGRGHCPLFEKKKINIDPLHFVILEVFE
jgi:hypothetical protein